VIRDGIKIGIQIGIEIEIGIVIEIMILILILILIQIEFQWCSHLRFEDIGPYVSICLRSIHFRFSYIVERRARITSGHFIVRAFSFRSRFIVT